MDKQELLDKMENLSQQLMVTLAELDAMKKQIQGVFEENARLRIENSQLTEQSGTPAEVGLGEKVLNQGKEHLEAIYNEGFHVCNDFYGQHRESNEDCFFCLGLLYR